jgi:hypothetical protein
VLQLIQRLNHKNIIIGSKVRSLSDKIDRSFLDNFYLASFKNKRLFSTVLSLLLRSNSFDYLLTTRPYKGNSNHNAALCFSSLVGAWMFLCLAL